MTQLAPPPPPVFSDAVKPPEALKTIVLDVQGMMCAGCVSTVEKKLAQCEGVASATVNLVTEVAAVKCRLGADPEAIAQALTDSGYPSQLRAAEDREALTPEVNWLDRQQQMQNNQLRQLTVASLLLVLSITGHLQHLSWAQAFSLPVLSTLWFHATLATLTLIFPARKVLIEGAQGVIRGAPNMNTLVSLGALSAYGTSLAALLFPGLGWECFFDEPVMLLSFILLGRTLEQRARFQAAGSLRSLIALQPTLARLVPNPAEKSDAKGQDAKSQTELSTNATEPTGVQIPASQVQVGEWLRVLPSEKVPVDGVIVLGQTTLDESMLTGEFMPIVKQPGDEVVAGSLNQSGAITLQVSRTGLNTTLAKMIHLVETAQSRKAPIQRLADLISGYFTYGILTCAALTFGFWYWVGVPMWPDVATSALTQLHHGAAHSGMPMAMPVPMEEITRSLRLLVSLKLAIAVLVVACPCALGLATPTAILVGSGIGAQKGLLIRGGDILEAACRLDVLVFDKTGTLTTGEAQLTDCVSFDPKLSSERLLQIAATVESGTRHPLGVAIQRAAAQKDLALLSAYDFHTQAGFGIAASLDAAHLEVHRSELADSDGADSDGANLASPQRDRATRFYLGNLAWMNQNGCALNSHAMDLEGSFERDLESDSPQERLCHRTPQSLAHALGETGKTAVFVAQGTQVVGLIGVADTLRADAIETVSRLRSLGLRVQILSGDSLAATTAIAQQLGLTAAQSQAEVTPQGKVEALAILQKGGDRVGFVGDGINDAPALAQADVGIALNSGTEVAMETADIVLMGDSLAEVLTAIQLSRATFNKIRQNLVWAFAYNLVCIPLAAGAFLPAWGLSLNPGFAGGLMALSSVSVVLNSLLLKMRF
jgi:P-type Cu2+ transporter